MLEGIGIEGDGYRLTVGETRGMQLGIDISNQSDRYRLTVGGYSWNAGRY